MSRNDTVHGMMRGRKHAGSRQKTRTVSRLELSSFLLELHRPRRLRAATACFTARRTETSTGIKTAPSALTLPPLLAYSYLHRHHTCIGRAVEANPASIMGPATATLVAARRDPCSTPRPPATPPRQPYHHQSPLPRLVSRLPGRDTRNSDV